MAEDEAKSWSIQLIEQPSPRLHQQICALMPELSASGRLPSEADLTEIIASPATFLFVASEGGNVLGMLTLIVLRIPSALRAHIEDVVVSKARRREGIGRALTIAAMDFAKSHGVHTIDLTSRPARRDAIRLYEGLGFERRDTGVYRYQGR